MNLLKEMAKIPHDKLLHSFYGTLIYLPISYVDSYIALGMAFPIACEIGKRITFTRTYDLKFIKLSFSQGWENQEVVYGIFQGIALWYTIIFLICYN